MIPIIIPAYEPDIRMLGLLEKLKESKLGPIVIVNDGSGSDYDEIFAKADKLISGNGIILRHESNCGKGRALKTAFAYVLQEYPEAVGLVTADSDGQHSPECICAVKESLLEHRDSLILGVRSFDSEEIPWKSSFGNKLTMKVLGYASGLHVSDTQTGLRGIPIHFVKELLDVQGERFEFEMNMLLESVGRYPIEEVKIQTIYDSKENHQTHFNPVVDSWKIYKILLIKFIKYIFASVSSCLIDIGLFALLCHFLRGKEHYIIICTVIARVVSATYNYSINYKIVFKSKSNVYKAALKYFILAIMQMTLSASFVSLCCLAIHLTPEWLVKVVIDTILFFISYYIQQQFVFKDKRV